MNSRKWRSYEQCSSPRVEDETEERVARHPFLVFPTAYPFLVRHRHRHPAVDHGAYRAEIQRPDHILYHEDVGSPAHGPGAYSHTLTNALAILLLQQTRGYPHGLPARTLFRRASVPVKTIPNSQPGCCDPRRQNTESQLFWAQHRTHHRPLWIIGCAPWKLEPSDVFCEIVCRGHSAADALGCESRIRGLQATGRRE